MDRETIAAHMWALSSLGSRISLIERSHLGEFSWPFAEVIRHITDTLFVEEQINGSFAPILHVIAEGMDYQIVDDAMPRSGMRRIVIVAFPRQLKHHVLLHAIFGHELAHTAINAEGPGLIIRTKIMPVLSEGPLQDSVQVKTWLKRSDAPSPIREELDRREDFEFPTTALSNWRIEIVCDLFGLMLFGPAFAAAHRTIIEALCARPDTFDLENSTHPPYPIRQRILTTAIRVLGWDVPITTPEDGSVNVAESKMLAYVTEGPTDDWFELLSEDQIRRVLNGLDEIFAPFPGLAFERPNRDILLKLIKRLTMERPPIAEFLSEDGKPTNCNVPSYHCLYAGWSFWFGRELLLGEQDEKDPLNPKLTFFEINRLCDHAILQQQAIDLVNKSEP